MNTPPTAETERYRREAPTNNGTPTDSTLLQTYLCCLTGGAIAAIVGILLLPLLVQLTRPFGVLSSITLVSLFLFGWMLAWLLVEYVWEVRSGRVDGST
jgi:hypothetical protein